ncbi:MAG TPA: gamma-glutamyltransferase [Candidatus Solibacter sp.]|nr:gamma-glutamyltransferase [Candidatus Solibacter sp.]
MIEGVDITAPCGVVATGPAGAARAGASIFEHGGNAMDAAAAACLACAMLEPQAVDLGGYVAAGVVLEGATGRIWSLDANAVAPAASREDMYEVLPVRSGPPGINELEYNCSVRDDANVYGPCAVAVPGFVAGVGTLWELWGVLKWPEVVAPARELADTGLSPDQVQESLEKKRGPMARFGAAWRRAHLVRTIDRLSAAGWRDFYDGELGRTIGDFVSSQGGALTRDDMAAFAPRVTEPLSVRYGDATIHTAISPNGGFSVLDALVGQAIAFRGLSTTSPEYWESHADLLTHLWRARLGGPAAATPHGTIHVAAADQHGNLVSMTISQGGLFGSCLAVPRSGIILAHGMCRFDPHLGHSNSPGPGKRPLNNVCPLIIRQPDRDVAIGARGGRRIVSVMTQLAHRIIDHGVTVREAATAPRMHTITGDPLEISRDFDPAVRDALAERGHNLIAPEEVAGAVHGVEILHSPGKLRAGGNTWAAGV